MNLNLGVSWSGSFLLKSMTIQWQTIALAIQVEFVVLTWRSSIKTREQV